MFIRLPSKVFFSTMFLFANHQLKKLKKIKPTPDPPNIRRRTDMMTISLSFEAQSMTNRLKISELLLIQTTKIRTVSQSSVI